MFPQLAPGGGTPSDRKLSAPSWMIATPAPSSANVSCWGSRFGARWNSTIRQRGVPPSDAASMKFWSRSRSVAARASRAKAGTL